MPKTRVTLASNANQKTRSVVLLETSSDTDLLQQIHEYSKNKLRIKDPKRIFGENGNELHTSEEVAGFITNDCCLLVSSGENFVGAVKTTAPAPPASSVPTVVRVLANRSFVDQEAVAQLKTTSTLSGVELAVGMPDLHPGGKHPVGCTFGTSRYIYPALIGNDIGCGMALYALTGLSADDIKPDKFADKLRGIESAWDGDTKAWLAEVGVEPTDYDASLGTIGGGNHFAEITVVEKVKDAERFEQAGLSERTAYLLVHSGSRGLGQSILESHTKQHGTKGLEIGTPDFDAYMKQHETACKWARRNRELIAHRILSALNYQGASRKILDIWHNNVCEKSFEDGRTLWLHRKGAAPSDQGLVVIPGSRGAYSFLVLPEGGQETNAYSLAHGAGRKWTRTKAQTQLRQKYRGSRGKELLQQTRFGGAVVCEDPALLFEEAPEVYKQVEDVVEDLSEFCKVVAILKPLVTYKLRKE
ncbi:hypothetical protein HK102_010067 [Quaeritorhiza haematococci]|nr:hypothetical protein HK102_010067 [Quaeritorhiza haematococci]